MPHAERAQRRCALTTTSKICVLSPIGVHRWMERRKDRKAKSVQSAKSAVFTPAALRSGRLRHSFFRNSPICALSPFGAYRLHRWIKSGRVGDSPLLHNSQFSHPRTSTLICVHLHPLPLGIHRCALVDTHHPWLNLNSWCTFLAQPIFGYTKSWPLFSLGWCQFFPSADSQPHHAARAPQKCYCPSATATTPGASPPIHLPLKYAFSPTQRNNCSTRQNKTSADATLSALERYHQMALPRQCRHSILCAANA